MKILLITFTLLSVGCEAQNNDTIDETHFMIEDILKIEAPTTAIIELDEYLNRKSNYGEKINSLSDPEKVVLLIENLEREINNGGFNQFYFNSSGNYANETYESLIKIGAIQTAKIVLKANNEWPNSNVTKNWSDRQDLLLKIESKSETTWNECDQEFYEYNDDIVTLLFEYVKENKNAFY
jgi:hypothetical protein